LLLLPQNAFSGQLNLRWLRTGFGLLTIGANGDKFVNGTSHWRDSDTRTVSVVTVGSVSTPLPILAHKFYPVKGFWKFHGFFMAYTGAVVRYSRVN
jgi:hypothetical protein